jgi:uncharacterized protein
VVAIGNGTASRETEQLVSAVLESLPRESRGRCKYAVVSEAGASVYSACEAAAAELPALDVTLRGAVSIARRLQDPLAELVKVPPEALGVGARANPLPALGLECGLGRTRIYEAPHVRDCGGQSTEPMA